MGARDAIHRVIDRNVKNSEATGRDWRCSTTGTDRIESGVVPVSDDIATGGNADGRDKVDDADANYEKRTPGNPTHDDLLKKIDLSIVEFCRQWAITKAARFDWLAKTYY
jgi:hypothetical protein